MAEQSQITCPHCGQSYAVQPDQWAQYNGQTINCTKCGKPFTVTAPPQVGGPLGGQQPSPAFPPAQPAAFQQPPAAYPPPSGAYGPPTGAQQPPSPYGSFQGQQYPVAPSQGNGWATTSLIFGILGLVCILPVIGGIVAIITGIVGLGKTRDGRAGGKGLAIAGISMGGISLLFVPLMIAMLLPNLNRAREQANRIKCASEMKQIGLGIAMYSNNDPHQALPPDLKTLIDTQGLGAQIFVCPSSNDTPATGANPQAIEANIFTPGHLSYVYVGDGLNASASPDTVVLYENPTNHLSEGMNVLFADYHVEWVNKTEMQSILDQKAAGKKTIAYPMLH